MNGIEWVQVMNNTKWDELRMAMYSLEGRHPQWRTKDVQNGYVSEWDSEWFHHFRIGGYETIEWVEIRVSSPEQEDAVRNVLKAIHVPGEMTEHGFRIYGYIKPGQQAQYIE